MMRVVLTVTVCVLGTALLSPLFSSQKPVLGAQLPDLSLRDVTSAAKSLSVLLNGKPAVLLPLRTPVDAAACEAQDTLTKKTRQELNRLGFKLIAVSDAGPTACNPDRLLRVAEGRPDFTASSALLIDKDRTVRRLIPIAKDAVSPEALVGDVRQWLDGMATFKAQCVRCHGDDGRDTSYPGTKSLAGIGSRHSELEIIELIERGGFVDLSAWKSREKLSLSIFVAGL